MLTDSEEEKVAKDYISSGKADVTLVIVDATCLERNLNLVYQIMNLTDKVIVCVNLLDEARKKGIKINLEKLSTILGVPVVGTIARKKKTLQNLMVTTQKVCTNAISPTPNRIEECITDKDFLEKVFAKANEITSEVCTIENENYNERDKKIDKILTSKKFGIPIMILFFCLIFWITIVGANYPSELLSQFFSFLRPILENFLINLNTPS